MHAADTPLHCAPQIVEESPIQMEISVPPPNPGEAAAPASVHLVPALLRLLQTAPPDLKRQALAVLNLMTRDMPPGIATHLDT